MTATPGVAAVAVLALLLGLVLVLGGRGLRRRLGLVDPDRSHATNSGGCFANHCRIFWFVHVHSKGWA